MSPVTRGFHGRRRTPAGEEGRVPPGQYVTSDFPVLSAGPTQHTPTEKWTFSITQGGDTKKSWTWDEMRALPEENVTTDIHCVTRWSKLDTHWQAVSIDTLLEQVEHQAAYVLAFSDGGYTTNVPGAGNGCPLPQVHQRADGHRTGPRAELRGSERPGRAGSDPVL